MKMDDSRLIARFQRLITESLIEKRLGQRRDELTDELYQTWREVEQCGLKETPEYRNVMLRVRSVRFVARRIGEAQQPRCCAPLFKRNRAHRHAERFPRGGVTADGDDLTNAEITRGEFSKRTASPLSRALRLAEGQLANSVSEGEPNDQTDCNFQYHR
jgi:hypothetical protein